MTVSIQAMLQTIYKLQEAHDALLDLANEKTRVLVRGEVDQLNQIVNKENKWIRAISEADQQRAQAVSEYLLARGYHPNPRISVSDLIKIIFKAEEKQALADAQKSLLTTIEKLRERNTLNQQMIQQSLAFVDYTLDLVLGPPDDEAVYQNPMQQRNGNRPGVFDTKA
jgi:flagellar biosynthesis/type III secretory pathway chaperone